MKKLTTIQIAAVYSLINNGTLAKIEKGSDRYAVIKALRVMKPIAEEYETNRVEAIKRLREGHEEEGKLVDRINRNLYHLTGYDNQYPILLVDTDYPTDISVQIYYRFNPSGARTWTLGDGGTIEHLDDYILIEN